MSENEAALRTKSGWMMGAGAAKTGSLRMRLIGVGVEELRLAVTTGRKATREWAEVVAVKIWDARQPLTVDIAQWSVSLDAFILRKVEIQVYFRERESEERDCMHVTKLDNESES